MSFDSQKISVIIPTKDRPQDLARCLESILNQTLLPDEIIVVDASDTEELNSNTIAKVREKIKINHLRTAAGLTHQKNVGVEASSGDIIFFLDDDVILEKDFIKEIVEVFDQDQERKIGGVSGRIVPPKTKSPHGWLVNSLLAAYYVSIEVLSTVFLLEKMGNGRFRASGFASDPCGKEIKKVEFIPGGLTAWKRWIFSEFKFDENLRYMEDNDFSYRVSRKHINMYTPRAKVIHSYSPVARIESGDRTRMAIEDHYYLFKKNLPQTFKHKLAFYWSLVGLCLQRALEALVVRDMGVLKGVIAGLVSIKKGKGVPTHSNANLEKA